MSKPKFTSSLRWVGNSAGQMTSEAQRILRSLIDIVWKRTGLETSSVVTGTAGTAGHYAKWDANGDLVDGGSVGVVLAQNAQAASVTGTTTETVLATIAIPAGTIGANGQVVVETVWSITSSANNKSMRVRFGAASAGTGGTALMSVTFTAGTAYHDSTQLMNRNSASSQITSFAASNRATTGGWGGSGALVTAAIDTSAATEIAITGELANTGETITLEAYRAIVYPKT